MRSNLLFKLSICLIIIFSANKNSAQFRYGFEGGFNLSEFSMDIQSQWNDLSKSGGTVIGLRVEHSFNKHLSISLQPRYISKSGEIKRTGFDRTNKNKITLNYVELPVYIKYTQRLAMFRPYLIAGFTVNHFLNGENERETESWESKSFSSTDLSMNRRDYSFDAGIGTEYAMNKTLSVFIEARRAFGLQNIKGNGLDLKYNNYQFTFGSLVSF